MYISSNFIIHICSQELTSSPQTHHIPYRFSWKCIFVCWQLTIMHAIKYTNFKSILCFQTFCYTDLLWCHNMFYYPWVSLSQFSLKSQNKSRENWARTCILSGYNLSCSGNLWTEVVWYALKTIQQLQSQCDLILCFVS